MFVPRDYSIMAIIPISLFLTASFFVLFALRKVAEKWLKVLGYLAASLLLLSALIIFLGAVCSYPRDFSGMRCPMSKRMEKRGMMQMMHQKNMPDMAMPENKLPTKE
ncbi:MAG: hypothetical protein PHC37_03940 [Candidatus Omnitrophica bacterium]|nr:hypothetical protein [Candidatus Omnitrophota bacterium]MDD5690827.1 hypothetical protein [Candidatus Omnitrophota bacterium]